MCSIVAESAKPYYIEHFYGIVVGILMIARIAFGQVLRPKTWLAPALFGKWNPIGLVRDSSRRAAGS